MSPPRKWEDAPTLDSRATLHLAGAVAALGQAVARLMDTLSPVGCEENVRAELDECKKLLGFWAAQSGYEELIAWCNEVSPEGGVFGQGLGEGNG